MSEHTIQIDAEMPDDSISWRLEVVHGPHTGTVWVFDRRQELTLGRMPPSQLRLPNETTMSRTHLRMTLDDRGGRIEDLKSSNGTRVNGVRVALATLSNKDVIEIGQTQILFLFQNEYSHVGQDESMGVTSIETSDSSDAVGSDSRPSPAPEFESTRLERPRKNPLSDSDSLVTPLVASAPIAETIAPSEEDLPATRLAATGSSIPTQVGPYRMIKLLGQGGMATVHLAEHLRTNKKFAVKLIRSDVPVSDKQTQLFFREAGVLTRLNHPRIVKAIEFGMERRTPYLVMQYIPTIDLFELLQESSAQERIKIAAWSVFCVLQALHYAHSQGIIHRDIKPGNLLAYRDGRHLRVKLADFGLAKCYEDAGLSQMTNERSLRGTLAYMAPEQFENSRDASPLVDLFACGACLYRLTTGTLPNVMAERMQTLHRLQSDKQIPDSFQAIIRRSIQENPASRFTTATEFATALHPFCKGRSSVQ